MAIYKQNKYPSCIPLVYIIILLCSHLPTALADIEPEFQKLNQLNHLSNNKLQFPVSAKGFLLMDYHSGEVIKQYRATKKMPPASLTKLMTAYLVFEKIKNKQIKLSDKVLISHKARSMIGSRTFLEEGSEVSIEQLLKGLIVQSGNDAAIALAEHVSGSESKFVRLMNQKAKQLGMFNTKFKNATGFSRPGHYSTAYDLALLAKAIIKNHSKYYFYYSISSFSHNHITQKNRNLLLKRDPSVDGIKTGFTRAAGYCLIASAKRNGRRLISVVLNDASAKSRARSSKLLLDHGFKFYHIDNGHPEHNNNEYLSTVDDY